mmetsp:Transcript_23469/g.42152  ORF Transcript_23469/g.42152 Transcript_23469/m.42152 type:complete len:261 (-) Transcript_23469:334-1116(-)
MIPCSLNAHLFNSLISLLPMFLFPRNKTLKKSLLLPLLILLLRHLILVVNLGPLTNLPPIRHHPHVQPFRLGLDLLPRRHDNIVRIVLLLEGGQIVAPRGSIVVRRQSEIGDDDTILPRLEYDTVDLDGVEDRKHLPSYYVISRLESVVVRQSFSVIVVVIVAGFAVVRCHAFERGEPFDLDGLGLEAEPPHYVVVPPCNIDFVRSRSWIALAFSRLDLDATANPVIRTLVAGTDQAGETEHAPSFLVLVLFERRRPCSL